MTKAKLILLALVISAKCFAQTTVTRTVQANFDTLVTTTTVSSVTLKYKPPVTPPSTGTNPGGPVTKGATYNNQSNITITAKTFHAAGTDILTFNNCTNVTITWCSFDSGNVWGVVFNNCKNVIFMYNYGTKLCKMAAALNSQNVKFDHNQFLNLYEPTIYRGDFAHVFQFNNVTGAGNSISYNTIENIQGVAVHAHDLINCYNSSGIKGDSLLVIGNVMRGGQIDGGWPNSGDTGAGITFDNGAWFSCRNNVGVNPGCAFIQTNGTHSDAVIANNTGVSLIASKVAADGIIALGAKSRIQFNFNRINWLKKNGAHGIYSGGETGWWSGGQFPQSGIIFKGNNWFDQNLTADILPKQILTYHL